MHIDCTSKKSIFVPEYSVLDNRRAILLLAAHCYLSHSPLQQQVAGWYVLLQ